MWQKLWTEARRCFPQSYWSVIGLVGRERRCVSELREGEGGAFRLHNKVGASEIEEGRENAAEGRTRLSVALGQRDTQRFSSLVFWLFTAPHFLFLFCHSSPLCSHSFCSTDFPFTDTVSPCSLCYTVLHLDNSFILTHGYLTVSFSFCLPSSSALSLLLPLSLSTPPYFLTLSSVSASAWVWYFLVHLSSILPSLRGIKMPVLEGLWGPDLRMRDTGLDVGVCPEEPPDSPVWGPLRTPPVTCGGLSLALELPALIRQLRAAWRARKGGSQGSQRNQASPWVESGKEQEEEIKLDTENRSARVEGNASKFERDKFHMSQFHPLALKLV